jgi:DNA polymerase sigma
MDGWMYDGRIIANNHACLQLHPIPVAHVTNLAVLLTEFFELYGCHINTAYVGIATHKGGTYFPKVCPHACLCIRGWLLVLTFPCL